MDDDEPRSIIRDACDLRDLRSCGAELAGHKFEILDRIGVNTMGKHTDGPWRIERRHDGQPFGVSSPVTMKHDSDILAGFSPHMANIEGNARLIAAAPDLLAELKSLVHRVDEAGWHPSETSVARLIIKNVEAP